MVDYKSNIQKRMVCLNMSNKQPKNKTKERIPFKKTSETIKFFVINLAKELKILYTEKLKKKKKEKNMLEDWKRSVFIPIPKKGNANECSNYLTTALISHASKVMLTILKVRNQRYVN